MKYARLFVKGGTYFFTIVTYNRRPIFITQEAIELLNDSINYTSLRMPFEIVAYVILPDHLHYLWTLPENDSDFSTRWRLIKSRFTRTFANHSPSSEVESRRKKGEKTSGSDDFGSI